MAISTAPLIPTLPAERERLLIPRPFLPAGAPALQGPRGRLFPAAPAIFPWLERRFAPGAVTELTGPAPLVTGVLPFLLASVVAAGGTVSVRDGANRFAPYPVGALCRRWGSSAEEGLERLRVARAFTVHQMVTLVETWGLQETAETTWADLLVLSGPRVLFDDEDVEDYERADLAPHMARHLRRLLASLGRPLLLVTYAPTMEPTFDPREGPPVHETLRLVGRRSEAVHLEATRAGETLELLRLTPGQHHLDEYHDLPTPEVQPWDGPSLPTA